MRKRLLAVIVVSLLSGCSSVPRAATPAAVAVGAVIAAPLLFYLGAKGDSAGAPPEDVGCFERIEGGRRDTICPP